MSPLTMKPEPPLERGICPDLACHHAECSRRIEIANAQCVYCGERVGVQARYHKLPEGLAHEDCLDAMLSLDEQRRVWRDEDAAGM